MANLPETPSFDSGIYKLETTDPVQGGDTGISNSQAKSLANRTRYLKDHMDAAELAIAAIQAELDAPLTTPAAGSDNTDAATTAFVHRAAGGIATIDVAGNGNVTLNSDQWGCAVIILTGARTGDGNIIFPTRGDRWLVVNRTTGTGALTCKTAAGSGVRVARPRSKSVFCDGVNILDEETDLATRARVIVAATTLAPGDDVFCDFTGGTFPVTLPAGPSQGDSVTISGHFLTSNLTVARNGAQVWNKDGAKVAEDIVLDRNNIRAVITYQNGAWMA